MPYQSGQHHRRTIRLPGYDYSQPGAYFVTICADDRLCLFGDVVGSAVQLSTFGKIVREEWFRGAELRPYLRLVPDEYVIMPDHIHGILWITDDAGPCHGRGTARRAPTHERFGKPIPGSVPTIVRAFKAAVTKRINALRGTPGAPIWQRNYHEHVIRDVEGLNVIRQYIAENPVRWGVAPR